MLYAGLDLSRQRLDVHVLDEDGSDGRGDRRPAGCRRPADARRQRSLAHGQPVEAAIESMNGARFVHDTLELSGWDVEIADAAEGQGSGTPRRQDRQDRRLGAGRAGPPGARARDLAARPGGPGRARAGPLPAPPRPPPDRPQEPDPRHAHHLRPPGPGVRPVRDTRARAAREPRASPSPGPRPSPRACAWSTSSRPRSTRASADLRALRRRPPATSRCS